MLKSNLRIIMAKKKIDTITELVELSGLSRSAASKIYNEVNLENTHISSFIKLCDGLQCTLSDLIEYEPKKDKKIEP